MTSMIRRSLILAGLAVLAVAAIAYAHGPGYGNGYGNHMGYGGGYGHGYHMGYGPALDQLEPEQREAFLSLRDGHIDRMNALRDQAVVLENQLRAAQDAETAANIRGELTDTANRMHEEAATFRAQVAERFGDSFTGYGRGYAGCPGWNSSW